MKDSIERPKSKINRSRRNSDQIHRKKKTLKLQIKVKELKCEDQMDMWMLEGEKREIKRREN